MMLFALYNIPYYARHPRRITSAVPLTHHRRGAVRGWMHTDLVIYAIQELFENNFCLLHILFSDYRVIYVFYYMRAPVTSLRHSDTILFCSRYNATYL